MAHRTVASHPHERRSRIAFWAILGITAFLLLSAHPLEPDEGVALNAAWQLWHGKTLYVDFFEYIPPGSPYLVYWLWNIFDRADYLIPKIFSIALWLLSTLGVVGIAKRIGARQGAAYFAAWLWLAAFLFFPLINHNAYSSFAAVWFTYALLSAITQRSTIPYVVVGALGALVFLFLQTKGLAVLGAGAAAALVFGAGPFKKRLAASAVLAGSFLAAASLAFLFGNARAMLYALFIFPFETKYLAVNQALSSPAYILTELFVILWLLSLARRNNNTTLGTIAFLQAGLFLSNFYLVDFHHLVINAFPFLIVAAWRMEHLKTRFPVSRHTSFLAYTYATCLFVLMGISLTGFITIALPQNTTYYLDAAGGKRGDIFEKPAIQRADHIYAGPFMPNLYFELEKPNPFYFSIMPLCDPRCEKEILTTFKKVMPEFAFLKYNSTEKFGYAETRLLDAYIRATYKECPQDAAVQYPGLMVFARDICP